MKALYAAAAVAVFAVGLAQGAGAQNTRAPANPDASTPAVANPNTNNPGAPAAGANSFTEGQAKSRIEAAGYSNVSGLKTEKQSWPGWRWASAIRRWRKRSGSPRRTPREWR